MVIRPIRWFRRHPILAVLLALFAYAWIKWMTLPPDWYIVRYFYANRESLDSLVLKFTNDYSRYWSPHNKGPRGNCCAIHIDGSGSINREMTNNTGISESREIEYAYLLRKVGAVSIGPLRGGKQPVWITISSSLANTVSYLYSEVKMEPCAERIHEISGGMPAYNCTLLDENWYLFHH